MRIFSKSLLPVISIDYLLVCFDEKFRITRSFYLFWLYFGHHLSLFTLDSKDKDLLNLKWGFYWELSGNIKLIYRKRGLFTIEFEFILFFFFAPKDVYFHKCRITFFIFSWHFFRDKCGFQRMNYDFFFGEFTGIFLEKMFVKIISNI